MSIAIKYTLAPRPPVIRTTLSLSLACGRVRTGACKSRAHARDFAPVNCVVVYTHKLYIQIKIARA